MNKKIKVMVADNHEITRIGIKKLLRRNKELEIVAFAEKDEEILMKIKKMRPDVVVMDNNFKRINSLDVAEFVTKNYPDCKIIVHPAVLDEKNILCEIKTGISGLVPKRISSVNLIEAIKTVHKGDKFFKGNIADMIVSNYIKKKKETKLLQEVQQLLTKKEIEVLKLIGDGLSIMQIAGKLFISVRTVETHYSNIKKKLEIYHRAGLVKFAIKKNVINV